MKKLISTLLFLFVFFTSFASHIVGGELHYEYLGNDNYKVILKVYRDCYNGIPPFDDPVNIGIYDTLGNLVTVLDISLPGSDTLANETNDPCLTPPDNVCVEEAIYIFNVTLPPIDGGYFICWQRCCRNGSILNIVDPGNTGSSYLAHIPGPWGSVNSDPYFNNFPPTVICANKPLVFDHSATDLDGDSLVYELCRPYKGAEASMGQPNPPLPPPYEFVDYTGTFTELLPLPANPIISIDPVTGLLTGTPTAIGQYVVAICVKEYRNGTLLSEHKRDFQFNVTNCIQAVNLLVANDVTICEGDSAQLLASGVQVYSWSPTSDLSNDTIANPIASPQFTTTYTITGTNNTGCAAIAKDSLIVTVLNNYHNISPDTTIILTTSVDLNVNAPVGTTITWTPNTFLTNSNQSSTTSTPDKNIEYIVFYTFPDGCTARDTVRVFVDPNPVIIFPNAFSPNGDGKNELFRPKYIGLVKAESFRIYNRWGVLVYEGKDINSGWDGVYKGEKQEVGSYAYYFLGKSTYDSSIVESQGNFTLIR